MVSGLLRFFTLHRSPSHRGAALVELSIIFPLILTVLSGTIEIGRLIETKMRLSESLSIGLRLAAQQRELARGHCTTDYNLGLRSLGNSTCSDADSAIIATHRNLQSRIAELVANLKIKTLDNANLFITTGLSNTAPPELLPPNANQLVPCTGDLVYGRLRGTVRTFFGLEVPLEIAGWWPYLYQNQIDQNFLQNCPA